MEQDKIINPDIIIIPTGGTVLTKEGKYRSTSYADGDAFGTLGGYIRVLAASILARKYPNTIIMTTGKGANDGISPTHASVMKDELIRLGVDSNRIICEEMSDSTKSGIEQSISLINKNKFNNIVFISNEYHIPRLCMMWKMFGSDLYNTSFISAEDVIMKENPNFRNEFDSIKTTESYKNRLESENRGIEALRDNMYNQAPLKDKKEREV